MSLIVQQFPCLSDNYGFLLHDKESGETIAIDTPDPVEYLKQAERQGWKITQIWNTHWHPDHAGGNKKIAAETGARIVAPKEVKRLSQIDLTVTHGDQITLSKSHTARVIDVSGHTNGHVAFYFKDAGMAFVGDSLFALGCGRMFEGTAKQFWESLLRIRELPGETLIYCAHEYSAANAKFALHVDPTNEKLRLYVGEIKKKRARNFPTVPTTLSIEKETNPFLRADKPAIQAIWGSQLPDETFAALRAAKDNF